MMENNVTINAIGEERKSLFSAIAKAKGEFPDIPKNREATIRQNGKDPYFYRYADLAKITESTRAALAKHGLFVIQPLNDVSEKSKEIAIDTILGHDGGGTITSRLKIDSTFVDPKALGATVSYLRRYAVTSILGIAADDDIDEDGCPVDQRTHTPTHSEKAPTTEQTKNTPTGGLQECSPETFERKKEGWRRLVVAGKPVADMLAMAQTKELLTDAQKAEIASWAQKKDTQQ